MVMSACRSAVLSSLISTCDQSVSPGQWSGFCGWSEPLCRDDSLRRFDTRYSNTDLTYIIIIIQSSLINTQHWHCSGYHLMLDNFIQLKIVSQGTSEDRSTQESHLFTNLLDSLNNQGKLTKISIENPWKPLAEQKVVDCRGDFYQNSRKLESWELCLLKLLEHISGFAPLVFNNKQTCRKIVFNFWTLDCWCGGNVPVLHPNLCTVKL